MKELHVNSTVENMPSVKSFVCSELESLAVRNEDKDNRNILTLKKHTD